MEVNAAAGPQQYASLDELLIWRDGGHQNIPHRIKAYHRKAHTAVSYTHLDVYKRQDYGNNSLRRGKTDKKDAVKLANYGLDHWLTMPRYVSEEDLSLIHI